ncbi:hypothetical protein DFJ74DRAFT_395862 [Hyaloraphidium curvatum]|nr:hypothetical protein DFJ74DRAFT_395862 [Hyaloraphidium curvatum]
MVPASTKADQQYEVAMEMAREGKAIPPDDSRRVATILRNRLLDEAFDWLKQLAIDPEAPHAPSLLFLGKQYAADRRWAEALKLYVLGAEVCNNRESCLKAAEILEKGPGGVRKDSRRAALLREKATRLPLYPPPSLPAKTAPTLPARSFSESKVASSTEDNGPQKVANRPGTVTSAGTKEENAYSSPALEERPGQVETQPPPAVSKEAEAIPGAFPSTPKHVEASGILSPAPSSAQLAGEVTVLESRVGSINLEAFCEEDIPFNSNDEEPDGSRESGPCAPLPPSRKGTPAASIASRTESLRASPVLGPHVAPTLPPRSMSSLSLSRTESPEPEAARFSSANGASTTHIARSTWPADSPGSAEPRILWNSEQFKDLDAYVQHLPAPTGLSVEVFCKKYLLRTCKTQLDAVRAAFVWITEFVAWDEQRQRGYSSRTVSRANSSSSIASVENHGSPEESQEVLSTLKARGPGFANLFLDMCRAAKVPALRVDGFLKGSQESLGWSLLPTSPNHAWNVVNLDGVAYVVDCALGAASHPWNGRPNALSAPEAKGSKGTPNPKASANFHYFLMPPLRAIYTHYPAEDRFQFLVRKMDPAAFCSQPCYRPAFFANRFAIPEASGRTVEACGEQIYTIKLNIGEDVMVRAELVMDAFEGDREASFGSMSRKTSVEVVALPSSGSASTASLFGGSTSSLGSTVVEVRRKRLAQAQILYELAAKVEATDVDLGQRKAAIAIKIANRAGPQRLGGTLMIFAGSKQSFDRNTVDQMPLAIMYRVIHLARDEVSAHLPVSLLPMQFEFFASHHTEPEFYVMDPLAYALQQNDIVTFRCRLSNPWGHHAKLLPRMCLDSDGRRILEGPVKVVLLTPKEERTLPFDNEAKTWQLTVKAIEKGPYLLSVYVTQKKLQSFATWKVV